MNLTIPSYQHTESPLKYEGVEFTNQNVLQNNIDLKIEKLNNSRLNFDQFNETNLSNKSKVFNNSLEINGPTTEYLLKLFSKYGNQGVMSFEGLEHLLENIGLGNLKISDHSLKMHYTEEGNFREFHFNHDHIEAKTEESNQHAHNHIHENRQIHTAEEHYLKSSVVSNTNQKTLPKNSQKPLHQESSKENENPVRKTTTSDIRKSLNKNKNCMSAQAMLKVFKISYSRGIYKSEFLQLCPALVYQLDQRLCKISDYYSSLDSSYSYEQEDQHKITTSFERTSKIKYSPWMGASIAVVTISLAGLLLVSVIPLISTCFFYDKLVQFLIALAVGTLTGDAMLHLIPHALLPHDDDTHQNDFVIEPEASLGVSLHSSSHETEQINETRAVWMGFIVLCAMLLFLLIEKSLKIVSKLKSLRKQATGKYENGQKENIEDHSLPLKAQFKLGVHYHDDSEKKNSTNTHTSITNNLVNLLSITPEMFSIGKAKIIPDELLQSTLPEVENKTRNHKESFSQIFKSSNNCQEKLNIKDSVLDEGSRENYYHDHVQNIEQIQILIQKQQTNNNSQASIHNHRHNHSHIHQVPESIASAAWMVIMGDGLHNFTDGLAIGASFCNSFPIGLSTSIAVFCHELPHELGDFAVLLKAGMSMKQAILCNCLSSVLCFGGMVMGVLIGNLQSLNSIIFSFTAGIFLYIALADMLPQLDDSGHNGDETARLKQSNNQPIISEAKIITNDSSGCKNCILHLAGLMSGITGMLTIALFEENIKFLIT